MEGVFEYGADEVETAGGVKEAGGHEGKDVEGVQELFAAHARGGADATQHDVNAVVSDQYQGENSPAE